MVHTTLKFNTGRGYSPEGQIITAQLISAARCSVFGTLLHTVDFNDTTRCVKGRVVVDTFTPAAVLAEYDKGGYSDV